eukprot:713019-Prorocentrum_minimum.AAC.1
MPDSFGGQAGFVRVLSRIHSRVSRIRSGGSRIHSGVSRIRSGVSRISFGCQPDSFKGQAGLVQMSAGFVRVSAGFIWVFRLGSFASWLGLGGPHSASFSAALGVRAMSGTQPPAPSTKVRRHTESGE